MPMATAAPAAQVSRFNVFSPAAETLMDIKEEAGLNSSVLHPLWNQAAEEEEAPAKKEKTHFTVKLTELKAADKVKLIKEVKNCIQGLNLVQVSLLQSPFRIISSLWFNQTCSRSKCPHDVLIMSFRPSARSGQEAGGVSASGNPCKRFQRRSRETKSRPGGSRRYCGLGVAPPLHHSPVHLFLFIFSFAALCTSMFIQLHVFFTRQTWRISGGGGEEEEEALRQ